MSRGIWTTRPCGQRGLHANASWDCTPAALPELHPLPTMGTGCLTLAFTASAPAVRRKGRGEVGIETVDEPFVNAQIWTSRPHSLGYSQNRNGAVKFHSSGVGFPPSLFWREGSMGETALSNCGGT